MNAIPHPIPYQGSKRLQAAKIGGYVREMGHRSTFYEPFAGSGAMTLYAAFNGLADRFVLGDSCAPIVALWSEIVNRPESTIETYRNLWAGQQSGGHDYYNQVRSKFNESRDDPHLLLYLIVRCVKNAVRFNAHGRFTQSHDRRRLGMRPDRMDEAIRGASALLRGRCQFFSGDFTNCLAQATSNDVVYMDPPYRGTSVGPDKRYFEQLGTQRLICGLESLNDSAIPWVLSYDGMTGDKVYGDRLPDSLNAKRVLVHTGRSSQATLNGRSEETVESIYISAHRLMLAERHDEYVSLRSGCEQLAQAGVK